jgi:hypothetical protein
MSPTFGNRYLLLLALAVSGIGTAGAVVAGHWDLLAVFGMLDLILLALAVRSTGRRAPLVVRADLVAWLRQRAATHGESLDSLADRAIASYRNRLDATPGERRHA